MVRCVGRRVTLEQLAHKVLKESKVNEARPDHKALRVFRESKDLLVPRGLAGTLDAPAP